eukprot:Clim_evm94s157 gene=Clim_evmTU94s157
MSLTAGVETVRVAMKQHETALENWRNVMHRRVLRILDPDDVSRRFAAHLKDGSGLVFLQDKIADANHLQKEVDPRASGNNLAKNVAEFDGENLLRTLQAVAKENETKLDLLEQALRATLVTPAKELQDSPVNSTPATASSTGSVGIVVKESVNATPCNGPPRPTMGASSTPRHVAVAEPMTFDDTDDDTTEVATPENYETKMAHGLQPDTPITPLERLNLTETTQEYLLSRSRPRPTEAYAEEKDTPDLTADAAQIEAKRLEFQESTAEFPSVSQGTGRHRKATELAELNTYLADFEERLSAEEWRKLMPKLTAIDGAQELTFAEFNTALKRIAQWMRRKPIEDDEEDLCNVMHISDIAAAMGADVADVWTLILVTSRRLSRLPGEASKFLF